MGRIKEIFTWRLPSLNSQPSLGQVINANETPWKQNGTMYKAGSVHQLFLVVKLKSTERFLRNSSSVMLGFLSLGISIGRALPPSKAFLGPLPQLISSFAALETT